MRALVVTRVDGTAGRILVLWLIGIASMGRIAAAQARQTPPGPAFEVASVKPNRLGLDVLARSDRRLGPNLRPATTECAALRAAAASSGDRDPCGLRTFV